MTYPIMEQLIKAVDLVEEEHHAIVFLYKAEKQMYGKLLEEMENDILQKKNLFQRQSVISAQYWPGERIDRRVSTTIFQTLTTK